MGGRAAPGRRGLGYSRVCGGGRMRKELEQYLHLFEEYIYHNPISLLVAIGALTLARKRAADARGASASPHFRARYIRDEDAGTRKPATIRAVAELLPPTRCRGPGAKRRAASRELQHTLPDAETELPCARRRVPPVRDSEGARASPDRGTTPLTLPAKAAKILPMLPSERC